MNLKNYLHKLIKAINLLCIILIRTVRPLLGPAYCKFPVSCTQYAIEQLKSHNTLKALWLIFKRLLACNPFTRPH